MFKSKDNQACLDPGFYTFAHTETNILTTHGYSPITGENTIIKDIYHIVYQRSADMRYSSM